MLKIYLTRHGQNEDNSAGILGGRRDTPLTEKGIAQARETGEKIKELGLSFDAVYSSPLKRAFQTAETIAQMAGLPTPKEEPLLTERDFGVMTGEKIADIEKLCAPNIFKSGTVVYFDAKDAETFPNLMARAEKLLDKLTVEHPSGNILLVTHGDFGKMIYAQYYGLEWKEVLNQFHFGNCDLLLLSEDSPASESHVFKISQHNH